MTDSQNKNPSSQPENAGIPPQEAETEYAASEPEQSAGTQQQQPSPQNGESSAAEASSYDAPTDQETTDSESSHDETAELFRRIEDLQAQVQSHKQDVLRGRAELENFRKRAQRDKDEIRKTAAADLIEALLPVLDNMKLGLQSAEQHPEAKDVTKGFEMVYKSLFNTLKEQGLEEINPQGEPFDPNYHECVAHEPSPEVSADHVMQVVRAGYTLNGRLLRPANVIVSSGIENNTDDTHAQGSSQQSEETPSDSSQHEE